MPDVTASGVRFFTQRLGAAAAPGAPPRPTVVFLHGLVMDNLSSWYFTVASPMAAVADVLLYDLRGHGKSERPATGYALADMVADLAGVLDASGLSSTKVILVGNSFGGLLALAFALAHPSRVAGLALVDGHLGDEGFAAQMAGTLRLEGEARDRKIAESFQHWLGRHSERKSTRLADNAAALVGKTSLVADLAATPTLTADSLAALSSLPILALYGEHSDLRARAEAALGARVSILPGCTHSILWEATAEVRARLVAFVASLASAPGAAR